ncbi:FAD/NAD-P-binding domain-containing protein [Mycena metata]|uniref:FAD/NAD-P-binding domain-containing protein n=1 Tax=Mycena metata TaxID=1033252 RepID=A0AAD7MM29_9AGAR|nr:FAD/NAD-P-binding domain-containing protein [Mycena metata]
MALHQFFLVFLAFGLAESKQSGTIFHHPIQHIAVVGAGPAGLQAAAKVIEHNFTVRLFERAPHPGGNWLYNEDTPVRESYPDEPTGMTDQMPAQLPTARYYSEGDGGLTLKHRWTEHWRPRPVWYNLFTNSPKVSTELPDVSYDPGTPWVLSHHTIQRHVRSYAAHHCLNSNDYCPKTPGAPRTQTWVLTLRRLERLPESNRIYEEWWTEKFDAVVLASGPYTFPHVPEIEGIVDWSKAKEGDQFSIYHSQVYRRPERYAGKVRWNIYLRMYDADDRVIQKTVLIVGASVSASEIARDLSPFAHRIIASVRAPKVPGPPRLRSLSRFPNITEFVPEITSFEPLNTHAEGIRSGRIHLINGSIILATGYRSNVLTTRLPENISWTGHYVPDPTLAFCIARPWTIGRYQSYGFAKVWEGSAPLPPPEQPPEVPYPGLWFPEAMFRRYITWLNDASLEHGGRFVEPFPIETIELLKYYTMVHFLNVSLIILVVFNFGLDSVSMFGKLEVEDPWDALVDEGSDW